MPNYPTDSSDPSSTPPLALPDELAPKLAALDPAELRAVIAYARSLLPTEPASADLIDEQPGEEILEISEHEGYTTVVKAQPCVEGCDDCPTARTCTGCGRRSIPKTRNRPCTGVSSGA